MKLIVGLGNPDKEYLNTFHNLGYVSVEKAAALFGVEFSKTKCRALIAESGNGTDKVIFAKPLTYMNLSGESVKEIMNFYKIEEKDLLVMYDDFDLPKGAVRIRAGGSAGTHNGMRNIIGLLGNGNFARLRVGFKPQGETAIPLINLVLTSISKEDKPMFDKATDIAARAAEGFAKGKDVETLMREFNTVK